MKTRTSKLKRRGQTSNSGPKASTTAAILGTKPARTEESLSRIDSKWHWHYKSLVALRHRLLAQRDQKRADGAFPIEPHSMDLADSATDEIDHDLALTELTAAQGVLWEVEAAIQRLLDSSYGVCEASGRPISAARLRAIPWTRFERDVEARLETKGVFAKPHLGPLGSVRSELVGDLEESEIEEEKEHPAAEDESLQPVPSLPLYMPAQGARARPRGKPSTPTAKRGRRARGRSS